MVWPLPLKNEPASTNSVPWRTARFEMQLRPLCAFGLLLSPIIASAAMSLSSVSVIANALRLRKVGL